MFKFHLLVFLLKQFFSTEEWLSLKIELIHFSALIMKLFDLKLLCFIVHFIQRAVLYLLIPKFIDGLIDH